MSVTPPRQLGAVLALTAALVGCQATVGGSGQTLGQVNDELRAQNLNLQDKNTALAKRLALAQGQIAALQQQVTHRPVALPGVKPADLPRVVALDFTRFTGLTGAQDAAGHALLRVYLLTLDQQGRFLPVLGQAVVQAVALPAQGQPVVLAHKTFAPAAFDQAYRSGLTGTHYTLQLPLGKPPPAGVKQITVKVTFTDAATGTVIEHEKALNVPPTLK